MVDTPDNTDLKDKLISQSEAQERSAMRTASHLSDMGTFTSLGASGLYFAEQAIMGERMPKYIHKISLTGVAVGIGAVIASMAYRQKAGKIAHQNEERLGHEVRELREWTERSQSRQTSDTPSVG